MTNVIVLNDWLKEKIIKVVTDEKIEWMARSFQDPQKFISKYFPKLSPQTRQELLFGVEIAYITKEQGSAVAQQYAWRLQLERAAAAQDKQECPVVDIKEKFEHVS